MVRQPEVGPKRASRRSERKECSVTPHVLQEDFEGTSRLAWPKSIDAIPWSDFA